MPYMLKLVRNTMASKLLKDAEGNFVMWSWSYIDKLEKLQKEYRIRLANKIDSKHVNFDGQKMKTTLAAQTLCSCIVKICVGIKKFKFKNCEATKKFITIFNNIFDICNSRRKFGRGFKRPIDQNTIIRRETCFKFK